MRETCLLCVSKHIAQSIVLVTECCLGYPIHIWIAIGHLAEAESESCSEYPLFAQKIRCVRLALMGQEGEFKHTDLVNLLKEARQLAEKINGIGEEVRMQDILYPPKEKIKPNVGIAEHPPSTISDGGGILHTQLEEVVKRRVEPIHDTSSIPETTPEEYIPVLKKQHARMVRKN